MRKKQTSEIGRFKKLVQKALYSNSDLRELVIGDTSEKSDSQIRTAFKKQVMSHLFVDDTITETSTFIFYDVSIPYIHPQTKTCRLIMYAICHKDILDDCDSDEFDGNRTDVLSQMIEDTLLNDKVLVNEFGIGKLELDSNDIYNSTRFYGRILTFIVPSFR